MGVGGKEWAGAVAQTVPHGTLGQRDPNPSTNEQSQVFPLRCTHSNLKFCFNFFSDTHVLSRKNFIHRNMDVTVPTHLDLTFVLIPHHHIPTVLHPGERSRREGPPGALTLEEARRERNHRTASCPLSWRPIIASSHKAHDTPA